MADSSQQFATVIGADASFKGELSFDSAAKVLGRFEGSISSKGKVHIADGSACKATISAKEVAVEGRIEGNVQANDRIEIQPTGIVMGDITAARMTMAEGASINGRCHIGPNGQSGAAAKPPAAAEAKPAPDIEVKKPVTPQKAQAAKK